MREIKDRAQIDAWVEAEHIRDTFDTRDLSFGARRFAKGEIIASPDAPLRELLFLVEGAVQIYGIRADGSFSPINFMTAPVCWEMWNTVTGFLPSSWRRGQRRCVCPWMSPNTGRVWIRISVFFIAFCAPSPTSWNIFPWRRRFPPRWRNGCCFTCAACRRNMSCGGSRSRCCVCAAADASCRGCWASSSRKAGSERLAGDAIGWNRETAKLPNENRPNCRIKESQIAE